MAELALSQTMSLKAFLKGKIKNFNQFFIKHVDNEDVQCTFFCLATESGKVRGLVAKTITENVNTQKAVSSGDYEVSWYTVTDDDGEAKSCWLIHRHADDGKAGKNEEIDFD